MLGLCNEHFARCRFRDTYTGSSGVLNICSADTEDEPFGMTKLYEVTDFDSSDCILFLEKDVMV